LKLALSKPAYWVDVSQAGKPSTYCTSPGASENVLQVSYTENKSGIKLEPTPPLEKMVLQQVQKLGVSVLSSESGECAYGVFGSSVGSTDRFPHFQMWLISNGTHFITATFTCNVPPTQEELRDVSTAIASLQLTIEAKSKWKLW